MTQNYKKEDELTPTICVHSSLIVFKKLLPEKSCESKDSHVRDVKGTGDTNSITLRRLDMGKETLV